MGQERNFSDIWIGVAFGVFVLSVFTACLIVFDNNVGNSDNLNVYISTPYNSSQASLSDLTSKQQQLTFNGSSYVIKDNQFIDTRGQGQAESGIKDSQNTIKSFFNNAVLHKYDTAGVLAFILVLIVTAGTILLIRIMLGRNRV